MIVLSLFVIAQFIFTLIFTLISYKAYQKSGNNEDAAFYIFTTTLVLQIISIIAVLIGILSLSI